MTKAQILSFNQRWDLAIPGDKAVAIQFAVEHFLGCAKEAIAKRGLFTVALSGGSTPNEVYQKLAEHPNAIDWSKVWLFWGDERAVSFDSPENNSYAALQSLTKLPIPSNQIFPMTGVGDLEENARRYEQIIKDKVPHTSFDLILLGMGEDGHTASLFPHTEGLHTSGQLVVANFVPQKKCWRITLTFDAINRGRTIAIYVLGMAKASILEQVLSGPYLPDQLPIQRVGTIGHKALWILDDAAAKNIKKG